MTRINLTAIAYLVFAATTAVVASRFEASASQRSGGGAARPDASVSIESGHVVGSADAPAVLVVFADFNCQYCARFATTDLPTLNETYVRSGRLQIAFMHNPLPRLRRHSLAAAEIAECAAEQGLFWPVHDAYFSKQNALDERRVWDIAAATGARLDGHDGVRECVASGRALVRVADHAAIAHRFRVLSTPAFLVGARDGTGQIRVVGQLSGGEALPGIQALVTQISG